MQSFRGWVIVLGRFSAVLNSTYYRLDQKDGQLRRKEAQRGGPFHMSFLIRSA